MLSITIARLKKSSVALLLLGILLIGHAPLVSAQAYGPDGTGSAAGPQTAADTGTVGDAIKAANGNGDTFITLPATFGFSSLSQALNTIISLIFLIAGLAAFVYILLGAFSYLTAGDDSAKTGKARTMITNAVVGLLLVALVYVIWVVAVNLVPGMKQFFNPTT